MGITYSEEENYSEYDPEIGYRSKKLKEINQAYHNSKETFIIGDNKLLKFDNKKWSLTEEKVSFTFTLSQSN